MDTELESAIAGVYGGPLDEFIQRRDALMKELRAAGKRDAATIVKALRKPSRAAWALDLAARNSRDAMNSLVAAVDEMVAAQSTSGDVRAATVRLRAAVREFAGEAAHAAKQGGLSIDVATLASAVHAVLGNAESFTTLRNGTLAEIPEAGGLDLVAAPTSAPEQPREQDAAAREAARQAELNLTAAREQWAITQRALRDAESKLYAAEARLQQIEQEARLSRERRDRAREEADTATTQLTEAEKAAAQITR